MQPVTATCFPLFLNQNSTHCWNNCVLCHRLPWTACPSAQQTALRQMRSTSMKSNREAWLRMTKLCTELGSPEALCAASSVGEKAKGRFNTRLRYNSRTDSCTHTHTRFCYGRLKCRKISKKYSTFSTLSGKSEAAGPASIPSTKTS